MLLFLLTIADESDSDRIKYIFDTYHGDMLKLAKSRLRKVGLSNYLVDAEDAVQNAFVKITKRINSINFDATPREIRAYILTIVSNEVINILKDYKYFDDIDDYGDVISDESFFENLRIKERYQEVTKALKKLDEKYSITFLYRYYQDMDIKEIAELMGISEKTVYTRLERGKKLLLDILQKED